MKSLKREVDAGREGFKIISPGAKRWLRLQLWDSVRLVKQSWLTKKVVELMRKNLVEEVSPITVFLSPMKAIGLGSTGNYL